MKNLVFEKIGDITTRYTYLFTYLLENWQADHPSLFNKFLRISVEEDKNLLFTLYPESISITLNEDMWDRILKKSKEYQAHVLTIETG
ncbi:hypothetical protein [Paraburkholderia hayleyella]|uniref:hypothetical protein n=1 Tax=Paraburkholderia hayleyella TaxID=2152889 RepID=UPI00129226B4|nr:hypothetical protein [Paraburkholderia hayleyella]